MSLYDSIKDITEQETKLAGKDIHAEEREPDHVEIPKKDKEDAPVKADKLVVEEKPSAKDEEPAKKDEAKPAEAGAKDPPPADAPEAATPEAFARLRREAAQAKRRAEAAEAQLKAAPTQPQPGPARTTTEKAVLSEPDPQLDPEAHLRWELAQTKATLKDVADWKASKDAEEQKVSLKQGAIKAYERYEQEFMPTVPDYKEATTYGIQAISRSISTLNPALQGEELNEAIRHQVLRLGAQAESRGEDPAEFFYNQSIAWGYKKADPAAAVSAPAEKKAAPTIKGIAEHKRKSATSLTPGGKSGAPALSREEAMKMGPAGWQKMTPNQLRELEAQEG